MTNNKTNRADKTPVNPVTLLPTKKADMTDKPPEAGRDQISTYYICHEYLFENLGVEKGPEGYFTLRDRIKNYTSYTELTKCAMCDQAVPFYQVSNNLEIILTTGLMSKMKEEARQFPDKCRHFEIFEFDGTIAEMTEAFGPILNTLKEIFSVNLLVVTGDNDLVKDFDNFETVKRDLLDLIGTFSRPSSDLEKENMRRPFNIKMTELPYIPMISSFGNDKHNIDNNKTVDISNFNECVRQINKEEDPSYFDNIPSLKMFGITQEVFTLTPELNSHSMNDWKGKGTDKRRYLKAHKKRQFWEKVHAYFREVAMLLFTQ